MSRRGCLPLGSWLVGRRAVVTNAEHTAVWWADGVTAAAYGDLRKLGGVIKRVARLRERMGVPDSHSGGRHN